MLLEWANIIVGLIAGGGLVTAITIPQIRKKADAEVKKTAAEAKATEDANMKAVADGWRELAEERQEANQEKDQRIAELTAQVDARYVDIGEWRDKYNIKCEELTELKVYKATNEVKLCMRRGCGEREPQSGY